MRKTRTSAVSISASGRVRPISAGRRAGPNLASAPRATARSSPPGLAPPLPMGRGRERNGEPRSELNAGLDPRFTFDAFVVGKPNEFAHACARRVAEQPASAGLQSAVPLRRRRPRQDPSDARDRLGADWRASGNGGWPVSVAYMSAEKFMYRFITALRSQSTHRVQGATPQRRRADGGRPAVPDRQG